MKFVTQTVTGRHGNCFSACVASILEIPISQVPNYCAPGRSPERWWRAFNKWLAPRGLWALRIVDYDHITPGYWIACGKTVRSRKNSPGHAVVFRGGHFVWDPHPSGEPGLTTIEMRVFLLPRDFAHWKFNRPQPRLAPLPRPHARSKNSARTSRPPRRRKA